MQNKNVVFNLYDFMPGYGENSVDIEVDGSNLIVSVCFDSLVDDKNFETKQIVFKSISD